MRNRALLGALAALTALAAACGGGDDDPTAPAIDPIVGEYRLRINGQMPFTFRPDSEIVGIDTLIYRETWLRDEYTLLATHRYSNVYKARSVDTSTAGGPAELDSLDGTLVGRWERTVIQGQNAVRLIADTLIQFGVRYPLAPLDTDYIPLPGATGWSFDVQFGHFSLGPTNPVVVNYTIAYVKQ